MPIRPVVGSVARIVELDLHILHSLVLSFRSEAPGSWKRIGASMMHVNVLHDNQSVYIREQSFGGAPGCAIVHRFSPLRKSWRSLEGMIPEIGAEKPVFSSLLAGGSRGSAFACPLRV